MVEHRAGDTGMVLAADTHFPHKHSFVYNLCSSDESRTTQISNESNLIVLHVGFTLVVGILQQALLLPFKDM